MSARFVPAVVHEGSPPEDGWLFLAKGLELVLRSESEQLKVPVVSELPQMGMSVERLHFLGRLDGRPCFTAPVLEEAALPSPYQRVAARALFGSVEEHMLNVAGRALAVSEWDATHRFCGRCGVETELAPSERNRRCPKCRTPYYPRLSPAIIVLIERDDRVLLARAAAFPRPWFSTLAGFVEPGESLEDCVHREVMEEVGIELEDLSYFGSQPWPFGRSLMVGFFARHKSGEVKVDGREIVEAAWFARDSLPMIPPRLSIARRLIDTWVERGSGAR